MNEFDKSASASGLAYPDQNYPALEPGLTIRQQAAIALKVPMSGIPELDAMIRESRRLDMATAAMQGILANPACCPTRQEHYDNIAFDACRMANALLAVRVGRSK